MPFPKQFLWGAATSAFQIEGATTADGRGDSVWDMVCRRPGFVERAESGDPACDHYRRLEEDLDLLQQLGIRAYRFSIAWPRVMPAGDGPTNPAGLDFYDRLADGLARRGIRPLATLFHWDYPTALFRRGGWLNPDSPAWFADYTAAVVDRLSDRIADWITLNEPQCFIGLGHETGHHAPGLQLPLDQVLLAGHHALLAHGYAVDVIRARAKTAPRVSYAPVAVTDFPDSTSPEDIEAARRGTFGPRAGETELGSCRMFQSGWWFDPVLLGSYPEESLREYGAAAPKFTDAEMAIISRPLDFLGLNLYHGRRVKAGPGGGPVPVPEPLGAARTGMGWPVTPDAMEWMARFFFDRYKLPIVVTENGRGESDYPGPGGIVHDQRRIDYYHSYLASLERAINDGVRVDGYFAWTLLDNFEWAYGYRPRFGLVYVDFESQKRTVKASGRWYADVVARNGLAVGAQT